jgi:hypothetical protein
VKILGTGWENVYWIHLARDRDQWWDLVNTVMKPSVFHEKREISWLAEWPNFSIRFCSMELQINVIGFVSFHNNFTFVHVLIAITHIKPHVR